MKRYEIKMKIIETSRFLVYLVEVLLLFFLFSLL